MEDFLPSVFDRLTDPESVRPGGRPGYTLELLKDVLRRDLADLLNTRRPPDSLFSGFSEVPQSIANFGIKELINVDALSQEQRDKFAQHMEEVIRMYEPRLTEVSVTARDPTRVAEELRDGYRKTAVYFRIAAKVNVDPAPPDGVAFTTILELSDGRHEVIAS